MAYSQTNFPEFQGQEKIVIRRYSDFAWLHDRLAEKYKGIFIPPLPEKSAVGNLLMPLYMNASFSRCWVLQLDALDLMKLIGLTIEH